MRIGFRVILYVLILNVVCGLMYVTAVPGTSYSQILYGTGNATDYADRFDAGELVNATDPGVALQISFVGHLLTAIDSVWTALKFTILGFPTMLTQIGRQIGDPAAKAAFTNVANILYVVFSFIMLLWFFQLITGRDVD